jgi:hypothetical protein
MKKAPPDEISAKSRISNSFFLATRSRNLSFNNNIDHASGPGS